MHSDHSNIYFWLPALINTFYLSSAIPWDPENIILEKTQIQSEQKFIDLNILFPFLYIQYTSAVFVYQVIMDIEAQFLEIWDYF